MLKDLLAEFAGEPTRSGSRFLKNYVADQDSELVQRFKSTGMITVGKTNTPEFGIVPFTEPELFGPTNNPWDVERTVGGSSGGSGAAVAVGMVPMASGGYGADGQRRRRRRLDPHPQRLLRIVRFEAYPGPQSQWDDRRRLLVRCCGGACTHPQRAR
ncbi:MAG: hypothetical protein E4G99_12390 [Anaerolineales bacterium]|nr:MAG: hypothetical protein E4G99_12390 [Anaerolineales bacterium]